jgi:hypothetical protein
MDWSHCLCPELPSQDKRWDQAEYKHTTFIYFMLTKVMKVFILRHDVIIFVLSKDIQFYECEIPKMFFLQLNDFLWMAALTRIVLCRSQKWHYDIAGHIFYTVTVPLPLPRGCLNRYKLEKEQIYTKYKYQNISIISLKGLFFCLLGNQ